MGRAAERQAISQAVLRFILFTTLTTAVAVPRVVERVGGDVSAPVVTHRVEPKLPPDVPQHVFHSPIILFRLLVNEKGVVEHVEVTTPPKVSPPWPEFVDAYQRALRKWRFKPARKAGKPVPVYLDMKANIHLR